MVVSWQKATLSSCIKPLQLSTRYIFFLFDRRLLTWKHLNNRSLVNQTNSTLNIVIRNSSLWKNQFHILHHECNFYIHHVHQCKSPTLDFSVNKEVNTNKLIQQFRKSINLSYELFLKIYSFMYNNIFNWLYHNSVFNWTVK